MAISGGLCKLIVVSSTKAQTPRPKKIWGFCFMCCVKTTLLDKDVELTYNSVLVH
jgi:hypothetical protein